MSESKLVKRVGERVRQCRTTRELSAARLAKDAGVSPAGLGKIERAESAARLDTVEKLANSLGLHATALVGEGPEDVDAESEALAALHRERQEELLEAQEQARRAKEELRLCRVQLVRARESRDDWHTAGLHLGQLLRWIKAGHPELVEEIDAKIRELKAQFPFRDKRRVQETESDETRG